MNIDEDILNLVQNLLGSSKEDKFETNIYSSNHPKRGNLIFCYDTSMDILNQSGIFLDKQKSEYFQPEGGLSVLINQFTQYRVVVVRKKLIDYLIQLRDRRIKESLPENEQIRKLISLILEKQVNSNSEQLILSFPLEIVEDETSTLQIGKLLRRLGDEQLIKVIRGDFDGTNIEIQIEILDQLDKVYRERGGYIKTEWIGTPAYKVDPVTGDFSWDKTTGRFDNEGSHQFGMLTLLIEHKNKPVSAETIYMTVWNKKISKKATAIEIKGIKAQVKTTHTNLRKKIGIVNRKDNLPGNIQSNHHKYTLYL